MSALRPFINMEEEVEIRRDELDYALLTNASAVIVYLDANDPEPLDVLLRIRQSRLNLGIIFIGGELDLRLLVGLFRHGLDDYLMEPVKQADIEGAIQRISLRKKIVKFDPGEHGLSKREFEVCKLLIKGLKSKDIATYLQITPATIKVHKARVMKKLNVNSLPDLVRKVSACS
jgi:FixJ family two-component response regulator